jgi:5-dehydro-4-deoxyglucarate dehydratase
MTENTSTTNPHAETTARLRAGMAQGVLSFPLTPFTIAGELDMPAFRVHVRKQLAAGPGAIFPGCGTGEYFSLSEDEYSVLIRAAVEEADGQVPVVAGAGYGWAQASRFTAAAQQAGADAILLLPPYLVSAGQEGLVENVKQVAARTELPLIVYQRGQVKFSIAAVRALADIPGVIGLKDGHSDLDNLQRIKLVAPENWLFFNGAATAEMQVRQYSAIGITAYSSAVHSFAPEIATAFFRAQRAGDEETVETLLREFYVPLVELRDRGTGYAVSLVKAAATLRGEQVGPVRAPLTTPTAAHLRELGELIDSGLKLVERLPQLATVA